MAICPACEAEIEIEDHDVSLEETVRCPECDEELTVTNLSPVELELVSDEDEDEDDDSYDDEDETADDEDGDDWDE